MRNSFTAAVAILMLSAAIASGQGQQRPYQVAIFLYEGVELLDFAGPGEVFSATSGFSVYTVSVDGKPIKSQGFVDVDVAYSIADAPAPDIIVVPGGMSGPSSQDEQVLNWIRNRSGAGSITMSVCTGAAILANTGLLDGKNITTFHDAINWLQARHPGITVLRNTRFVDSGNLITTAGVSAGIDGALHIVARLKGLDVARSTAEYMEYDKWHPEEGRIDYENEFVKQLRSDLVGAEKQAQTLAADNKRPQVFEGELRNVAFDYEQDGELAEAAHVLEITSGLFPGNVKTYDVLSGLYHKMGKEAPPTQNEFIGLIEQGKMSDALKIYEQTRQRNPGWVIFGETEMNSLGYRVLGKEDYATAIKIFKLNVDAYPSSGNVYDSLGEAFMKAGNKKDAITYYKRSLEIDPGNDNARKMLQQLGV